MDCQSHWVCINYCGEYCNRQQVLFLGILRNVISFLFCFRHILKDVFGQAVKVWSDVTLCSIINALGARICEPVPFHISVPFQLLVTRTKMFLTEEFLLSITETFSHDSASKKTAHLQCENYWPQNVQYIQK